MDDRDSLDEIKTTPEVREKRRQVWLTLLVMIGSSCVGMTILMVLLWILFKKIIPPGFF